MVFYHTPLTAIYGLTHRLKDLVENNDILIKISMSFTLFLGTS
jgi:hypothetical protein